MPCRSFTPPVVARHPHGGPVPEGEPIATRPRAALVGLLLLTFATGALASVEPVPGDDVVVRSHPAHTIVTHIVTDRTGALDLRKLPKGSYTLEIADTSKLKAPVRFRFQVQDNGGTAGPDDLSAPILPTKLPGPGRLLRGGIDIILKIPEDDRLIVLVVRAAGSASIFDRWGAQGNTKTGPDTPVIIPDVGHGGAGGDHGGGGSAGGKR